jgi:RNA-directed DNA polymerase
VPQGGVISTLLANLYLNDVDKMLERAKEVTREGKYTHIEYARFADDIAILVDGYKKWKWLEKGICKRLKEELNKIDVKVNKDKTKIVDLVAGESFSFLGFEFRRVKSLKGRWRANYEPKIKSRTKLVRKLKEKFRKYESQPVNKVVEEINPIIRGWVNYFRIGNSSKCFCYIKDWVYKKIRRHLMKARNKKGFGWDRWSRDFIYNTLKLYNDYRVSKLIKNKMSNLQIKMVIK